MTTANMSTCRMDCGEEGDLYHTIVLGLLLPLVAVSGIIFNSMNIFVLTRRPMRNSLNAYLCGLAMSDALICISSVPLFSMLLAQCQQAWISNLHSRLAVIVFPLSRTAQAYSIYVTVLAAVDVAVATLLPLRLTNMFCRNTVAYCNMAILFISCLIYCTPHWLELYSAECLHPTLHTVVIRIFATQLRKSPVYITTYYTYMYTIILTVFPLVLLIVLNTCILFRILSMRRRRPPPHDRQEDSVVEVAKGSTIRTVSLIPRLPSLSTEEQWQQPEGAVSLVLVVFLFIFCNSLGLLVNMVEHLNLGKVLTYMIAMSNLLVVMNAAFNLLVYYSTTPSFRRVVLQHMRGKGGVEGEKEVDSVEGNDKEGEHQEESKAPQDQTRIAPRITHTYFYKTISNGNHADNTVC